MGVGVVEAVVEDLAEHGREQAVGEIPPRHAAGVDRVGLGDRPADDRLHHQDALGRERDVDGRHLDPDVVRPVLAQAHAG